MPRPRFDNIDPEKKNRLMAAATAEFAANGYELASINKILDEAGFSKGSFYYYFDDKIDLAATVFLAAADPDALFGGLELPTTAEGFWAELRRYSMVTLKVLESKREKYECVVRLSNALVSEPALAARVLPLFEPGRRKMLGFLERGVELGVLRRDLPLPMITKLVEAVKLAAYKMAFPGDRVPTDAEMESFSDLVLDLARRIASPQGVTP